MTLIYFILVLGITVLIHELGHFVFAKKAGVHVYEFSIGMGPCLFKWHRKNDETLYAIRLLPIGGYVQMAGEDMETDDSKIPEDRQMCHKKWHQRFLITKINDKKINNTDRLILELQIRSGEEITLEVEHENGKTEKINVEPLLVETDEGSGYKYGFSLASEFDHSFIAAVKYGFTKTFSLLEQMVFIIFYLIIGKLSLNSLAGPIGIFNIVGTAASAGFINIIYLIGYISVNVGFINLLPIPAFDGGRLLFLIIEKIKGKPVNPKVENTIHTIGFMLLMLLMVLISYNDIMRLFK